MALPTIAVLDKDSLPVTVNTLKSGSAAAADSSGVALSTEDIARLGIVTETAPATDTASSGLNGRLQRIAQRLTTMIASIGTFGAVDAQRNVLYDSTGTAIDWAAASPVKGGTAADTPLSDPPVTTGGLAKTANPTAVVDGDVVNTLHDKLGKMIAVSALRDLKGKQGTTITASTTETTIVTAGGAGVFRDLYGLIVTNTSGTATEITIRDVTAGTSFMTISCPSNDVRGFMLDPGAAIPQTTANSAWTATAVDSVSSLIITALYVGNA